MEAKVASFKTREAAMAVVVVVVSMVVRDASLNTRGTREGYCRVATPPIIIPPPPPPPPTSPPTPT